LREISPCLHQLAAVVEQVATPEAQATLKEAEDKAEGKRH